METKDTDIAAILKDKPREIQLFDLLHCVKVKLDRIEFAKNKEQETVIWCNVLNSNKITLFGYSYTGTELGWLNGLQILKPSSEMQDWSKFVWRKGDVLQYKNGGGGAIFMGWSDDSYTHFESSFFRDWRGIGIGKKMLTFKTEDFEKADESTVNFIIDGINEYSDGKFNLSTLTIERLGSQFKDGDILYIEVGLYRSKYILIYCKDNEVFIPTYYCFLNLASRRHGNIFKVRDSPLPFSTICDEKDIMVVRLATDSEKQQLFSALEKEGKAWDAEKKAIVDLPKKCEFKPNEYLSKEKNGRDIANYVRNHIDNPKKYQIDPDLKDNLVKYFSTIENLADELTTANISHKKSYIKGVAGRAKEYLIKHT